MLSSAKICAQLRGDAANTVKADDICHLLLLFSPAVLNWITLWITIHVKYVYRYIYEHEEIALGYPNTRSDEMCHMQLVAW